MQWDEPKDKELDREDALRRWHSAKAVLLMLREELQQMRDFIDSLRIRRTQCKPRPVDLNDHGEAIRIDHRVQQSSDRLDSMEEALRLVCDRLDALVTVCDIVLDDSASDLYAAEGVEIEGCLTGSAFTNADKIESKLEEENDAEECAKLQTENRQLFDQILHMMRQVDDSNICCSSQDVATLDNHFQARQTQQTHSNENSEEHTDTEHVSESTEANSSHESSFMTCNGFSSGSASPNVWVLSTLEEISTDFTSKAINNDTSATDEERELVNREINKSSEVHEKVSEDGGVFGSEEQTFRIALQLFRKEKTLLDLQQRSNVMLHHELVQLSDENRKLQCIISELRTSLDLKNNEILTLMNKADHVSRLLDEQVEEFRCVFRAVTRESDEELDRLVTENSKLKSTLASINTEHICSEKEPTEQKLSVGNIPPHNDSYEAIIQENLACATPEKLQKEDVRSNEARDGNCPETEDEVSFPPTFEVSCPDSTELENFIALRGSSIAPDCHEPDGHLVVPVHSVEDLWSEVDAEKKTMPEERCCLAMDIVEHQRCLPREWNDSGAITFSDNNESDAADEKETVESTHLPLDKDETESLPLNICSTPMTSPHGVPSALQTGDDFHRNHDEMKSEAKLTKKHLSELNSSKNGVDMTSRRNLQHTFSVIADELRNPCMPDVKISSHTQTVIFPQSLSDSCLLSKFGHCESSSCDLDFTSETRESLRAHQCLCDYPQHQYPKHRKDIRSAVTQTGWQAEHADDRNAGTRPDENGLEISEQAEYKAFGGNVLEAYGSLKSELQCFQKIMVCSDFDIIHKHRVEDFSSSDLQFIMTHFKHHIEQKMILDEENCLLVEEVGRLLSDVVNQGHSHHQPVIVEEVNKVDKQEVEQHDLYSQSPAFVFVQKVEDSCYPKDLKHRFARYATELNEQCFTEQDETLIAARVPRKRIISGLQEMDIPVHLSQFEDDKPSPSISNSDGLPEEDLELRTLLQRNKEHFQQELLRREEENSHVHDELRSLQKQHSIQSSTLRHMLRTKQQMAEQLQRTSAELEIKTNELNDWKSRCETTEHRLLQEQCFDNDKLIVQTDNFGRPLEEAEHLSVDDEPSTTEKERLQEKIVEVKRFMSSSADEMTTDDIAHSHQYDTSVLLRSVKPLGKRESNIVIHSALYGSSDDVKISMHAPTSIEAKRLNGGKTIQFKSLQNNHDFDHLTGDSNNSRVRKHAEGWPTCPSQSPAGSLFSIGPLPFLQTNESSSLGDLVLQMRQQNARLACYLSAINSHIRQWNDNRTNDHNDPELSKTFYGLSGFTDLEEHRGHSTSVASMFLPIKSSPFMALSVVCLQRPLVVDLNTIMTLIDSDPVTSLREKLEVRYLEQ